jgi:predicted RNase H-like nuclease (RuvC/YqgF family)
MADKNQEQIIEGEEIDGDEATSEVPAVDALLSLEELIKNHIDNIDKLKDEIKQSREMFEDSFKNNPTYRENEDKVEEAAKARNSVRTEISRQPSVANIAQKLKDLRFDLNEQTKTLSDLLQDYHQQTGATQIETRDGQIMEIVSTSKLVRRSSK